MVYSLCYRVFQNRGVAYTAWEVEEKNTVVEDASYLTDRTQSGPNPSPVPFTCVVPQGSVVGLDLFSESEFKSFFWGE